MRWLRNFLMLIAVGVLLLCSVGMRFVRWSYKRSRSVSGSRQTERRRGSGSLNSSSVLQTELPTPKPSKSQRSSLPVVSEELDSSFGYVCCAVACVLCNHEWVVSLPSDTWVLEVECPKCGGPAMRFGDL